MEKVIGQLLDKLRLTNARAAHENEAHRLMLGGNAHTVAANGGSHSRNGLVLPHDVLLQPQLQL